MTNHPNRSRLTVIISEQFLTGNMPDEFNLDQWQGALKREYRKIVRAYFPNARCVVRFDTQNASGYCRPISVDYEHDSRVSIRDQQGLNYSIEQASNALYDARGDEFFTNNY